MFTDLDEFPDVQAHVVGLEDAALDYELRASEGRMREETARQAALLAEYDRRKLYNDGQHASMRGQLRASLHWSEAQCRTAMQIARLCDEFPDAGETLLAHEASVANIAEIARARANSRIGDQIGEVIGAFLRQAESQEHDRLCLRVRTWEKKTDRDHEHERAQCAHENRTADWHADGTSGELVAQFGPIDGLEVAAILAHYEDAEWRTDWEWAVETYGDDANTSLLPRTAAQRRADAVTAALRDAASKPPGSKPPEPVVNINLDYHQFQEIAVEAGLFPERNVDPFDDPTPHVTQLFCHTTDGAIIDQHTVLQLLLEGHIRWVIRNDRGHVIHFGHRKRLFEGAARDAVRLLSTRCTAPGCRVPTTRTETDHMVEFSKGGRTDPDNGNPACKRHNLGRHNGGFTVTRDRLGDWRTYRPDGTEVD